MGKQKSGFQFSIAFSSGVSRESLPFDSTRSLYPLFVGFPSFTADPGPGKAVVVMLTFSFLSLVIFLSFGLYWFVSVSRSDGVVTERWNGFICIVVLCALEGEVMKKAIIPQWMKLLQYPPEFFNWG